MTKQISDKNKHRLHTLYKLYKDVRSYQEIIVETKKAVEDRDKIKNISGIPDDLKEEYDYIDIYISDLSKAEEIASHLDSVFLMCANDLSDVVDNDIIQDIVTYKEVEPEKRMDALESAMNRVSQDTGVEFQDSTISVKSKSTDNYFSDMAGLYEDIALGLKEALKSLNATIDKISYFIEKKGVPVDDNTDNLKDIKVDSNGTASEEKDDVVDLKKEVQKEISQNEDLVPSPLNQIKSGNDAGAAVTVEDIESGAVFFDFDEDGLGDSLAVEHSGDVVKKPEEPDQDLSSILSVLRR